MKVLVTGGAGFIGSHIVDLLVAEHYEVIVIDSLDTGKIHNINPQAKFYQRDIRHKEIADIFMKEKPDAVIHCAAQISVAYSVNNPLEDASINILGSINILEAARRSKVKKIIYSSSAAVLGEPEYFPMDEQHPLKMQSGYGISKHTVERYLEVYKSLFDINYISLRYSNVYGPRQACSGEGGVIAIFCNKAANNMQPIINGDGNQIRNFVYVEDVAKANLLALCSEKSGIYNVCSKQCISVNDLLNYLNQITGKNIKAIYQQARSGDIRNSDMTYEKIYKELNWEPTYEIIEGLKKTLEYTNDSLFHQSPKKSS